MITPATGHAAAAALPGREPRLTTPLRLYALAGVSILLAVTLGVLVTIQAGNTRGGLDQIGGRSGPQVVATADLYFALNDMDAQLANVLLDGGDPTLAAGRSQALGIYEQRRLQAVRDIQQAAAAVGNDRTGQAALKSVLDVLGSYQALAAQTTLLDGERAHPAGRPPAQVLQHYRQATDLLKSTLLPAVKTLTDRNAATLGNTYQADRSSAQQTTLWIAVLGLALLGTLLALQLFLTRRFRRRLNLGIAAATVAALALVLSAAGLFTGEAQHLRVAKKDAFDSILALSKARSISYDANADESRYLLDPARADQYETAFLDKSQQLLQLPGAAISDYDAKLAAATTAYRNNNSDIRFQGLFGIGFRNITFPGERAAAEHTLATYQAYERDDRHIRALAATGDLRGAIAFDTGYVAGQSNADFGAYDQALSTWTKINQDAFGHAIRLGRNDLSGWTFIPAISALAVIGLTLLGIRPRLAEYR